MLRVAEPAAERVTLATKRPQHPPDDVARGLHPCRPILDSFHDFQWRHAFICFLGRIDLHPYFPRQRKRLRPDVAVAAYTKNHEEPRRWVALDHWDRGEI
mmetsp:Transcript_11912/g.30041  ORF Transcript_11912/g.30041 Transcript_11912/m.30041 type:complete len:100 (-) Transcript_11912:183-482(-)